MHDLLKIGQTVHPQSSSIPCIVEKFLDGGGQGEVYQANLGGKSVALKWYFPHALKADPDQKSRLEAAIESGAPNSRFLWPMYLVSAPGIEGFGYIMEIRQTQYKTLKALMKGRIKPNLRALATAGFQLADSFLQLHSRGLCYCDISLGNVFINPDTGDILICDNDNVTANGAEVSILGTLGFTAPEIVLGQSQPNTQTDLYSLAVLLFHMLLIHHPLHGKKEAEIRCLDLPAMNLLYGSEPTFIFDPQDESNRPVPDYHDKVLMLWQIYPQFLRDLFTKAFTTGIRDPQNGRVRESEWRGAMVRLLDSIVYCPHCGQQNFYAPDPLKQTDDKMNPCCALDCKKDLRLPPRIQIDRNIIMLNHDTKLFPHHISNRLYDFSSPIAEVNRHPTDPNLWGLKNLTDEKWILTTPTDDLKEVEPTRSILIAEGTKINFGKAEGEIRF